jgi:hypothetical protein
MIETNNNVDRVLDEGIHLVHTLHQLQTRQTHYHWTAVEVWNILYWKQLDI